MGQMLLSMGVSSLWNCNAASYQWDQEDLKKQQWSGHELMLQLCYSILSFVLY